MQSIRSRIKSILRRQKYSFQEDFEIDASAKWKVDFYIHDYTTAIIILRNLEDFFKAMFIAQDIMRMNPITIIIAIAHSELPFLYVQLASRYGIVILRKDNIKLLEEVIRGEVDVEEINESIPIVEKKASKKLAEACKCKIREVLSTRPLTEDEILDSLKYEFPMKTIRWCLISLKRQGKVKKLASLAGFKKFVLGVRDEQLLDVPKYYSVSRNWKSRINAILVQKALMKSRRGLTIAMIAKKTALKIPQVVAALRYLEKRNMVKRVLRSGKIYWKLAK